MFIILVFYLLGPLQDENVAFIIPPNPHGVINISNNACRRQKQAKDTHIKWTTIFFFSLTEDHLIQVVLGF